MVAVCCSVCLAVVFDLRVGFSGLCVVLLFTFEVGLDCGVCRLGLGLVGCLGGCVCCF